MARSLPVTHAGPRPPSHVGEPGRVRGRCDETGRGARLEFTDTPRGDVQCAGTARARRHPRCVPRCASPPDPVPPQRRPETARVTIAASKTPAFQGRQSPPRRCQGVEHKIGRSRLAGTESGIGCLSAPVQVTRTGKAGFGVAIRNPTPANQFDMALSTENSGRSPRTNAVIPSYVEVRLT